MKILKIFGIVVGIHVFALVLIFANPGCSSSTKPAPSPTDTVAASTSTPSAPMGTATSPSTTPPPVFNPDAPATAEQSAGATGGPTVRFTPTRPGTAVATAIVAEPITDVTPANTYTVKAGDSLWTIAKKHNLSVPQLTAANSLSSNAVLKAGQKLIIPGKPAAPTVAATAAPAAPQAKTAETATSRPSTTSSGVVKHVVKSGETLGAIARTYDVKPGDIAVANNISDPAKIRAGTELVIPGWQAPASKSGKSPGGKSGSGKSAPATTPGQNSTPPPVAPSTPPTISFDAPGLTPPPSSQTQVPVVPVIPIEDNAAVRPAPKSP